MMKNTKNIIIILLICLMITTVIGCEQQEEVTNQPVYENEEQQQEDIADEETDQAIEEEETDKLETGYFSPFSGTPLAEKPDRRALMVSIENSPAARPQAGLRQAELIYEFLVEGGITRFLALYWRDIPERIGPIRSLRPFLIETAIAHDSYLIHSGASPDGFALLQERDVLHLDQIYNGDYYWRDSEKKAPHNLYTGYTKLADRLEQISSVDYDSRFSFQQISIIGDEPEQAELIEIDYWGNYNVLYEYDSNTNLYHRYIYNQNQPHYDQEDRQLTARNIIIQFVNTEVKDKAGRLDMELFGEDKALIFKDGIVIEGYWRKEEGEWETYYTNEDEVVSLNSGQTWIQVVPRSTEINYTRK